MTLCMAVYLPHITDAYAVVPLIAAITFSALFEFLNSHLMKAVLFAVYSFAAVFYFPLIFLIPLVSFDLWLDKQKWAIVVVAAPFAAFFAMPDTVTYFSLALFIGLSFVLKYLICTLDKQRNENMALRDSAQEISSSLIEKNKELLEKQDYEINLATLRERNRIAREMHDTVGHLLSSSILQTGALLATSTDETQREGLKRLHNTLAQGMDSVRTAIHDLHDESIDLFAEIDALASSFTFCTVSFDYDVIESPQRQIKYVFVAIVKEALANVARHSNASHVSIAVHEHPALYQLVVNDNGTLEPSGMQTGLGLKNIRDRVEAIGGHLNISTQNGFELFISVSKYSEVL